MSKPTEIGPVQQALIDRGKASAAHLVWVGDYREMRAARKLVRRGVFVQAGMLPLFFLTPEEDESK